MSPALLAPTTRLVAFLIATVFLVPIPTARAADGDTPPPPLNWTRFTLNERSAFVVLPEKTGPQPVPWVLYAPTFGSSLPNERDEGWMFEQFLKAGIAIAGIDVGESYGSPIGRKLYNDLHAHLLKTHQFAPQATLLARSRGGLMLYNWAAENPEKIKGIAGIYPVCNLTSYPGLARACGAYEMTEEQLGASLLQHNPVNRLAPLARAGIPIFHIHGDVDKVVPLPDNSGALAQRYRELGGPMELLVAPGQGHNMWPGFFRCRELVDFVLKLHSPAP